MSPAAVVKVPRICRQELTTLLYEPVHKGQRVAGRGANETHRTWSSLSLFGDFASILLLAGGTRYEMIMLVSVH